jgi:hypothetical protein
MNEQAAAVQVQAGITVEHEDLRSGSEAANSTTPEVFLLINYPRRRVTNVLTRYN